MSTDVVDKKVDSKKLLNKKVSAEEWISRLLWCHYYKLKNLAEGHEELNELPILEIGEAWDDDFYLEEDETDNNKGKEDMTNTTNHNE